ncbi:MAG: prepilin-type N-terminal cleavage/methylation domain-containing protein [Armatimonadetes bacterium]|nr:prepilin-type N-terminal cleavage/methylation domain-containing protein [Armatimonadota bacterium]
MKTRNRSGFTLIELLVVIAIIAILAAILFPVFAKAREKAQTATCTSNLKQLATAMLMYTSDYDQRFPSVGDGFWNPRGSDWVAVTKNVAGGVMVEAGSLYPYVKNAQAYVCPNAEKCGDPYTANGRDWTRTSYTMNACLGYGATTGGAALARCGKKINKVSFPASTFMLIEENDANFSFSAGDYNDACFYVKTSAAGAITQCDLPPGAADGTDRHGGGAVAAYCDGHVKWHNFNDLAPSATPGGGAPGRLAAYYFPSRTQDNVVPSVVYD